MSAIEANSAASQISMTGTPAFLAILLQSTLFPAMTRVRGFGPMNLMPAASQASGKGAFSERNP